MSDSSIIVPLGWLFIFLSLKYVRGALDQICYKSVLGRHFYCLLFGDQRSVPITSVHGNLSLFVHWENT